MKIAIRWPAVWMLLLVSSVVQAQTLLWETQTETGSPFDSGTRAMTVDAAGNVYVTGDIWDGNTWHGHTVSNLSTVKYDTNGNLLWQANFNGLANGNDVGLAITTDSTGNVYVAGKSFGGAVNAGGTGYDWVTFKYDNNGNVLWTRRNAPAYGDDIPTAIKVDSQGHVIVLGTCTVAHKDTDIGLVAYDTNGTVLWSRHLDGSAHGNDIPGGMVLDSAGNIYVCGSLYDGDPTSGGTGYDWLTVKFNASGQTLWMQKVKGTSNQDDLANAITLDSQGNVLVAGGLGMLINGQAVTQMAFVKYGADGHTIWGQHFYYPGSSTGTAYAVAVDSQDNVIVTGGQQIDTRFTARTIFTIKYDASGALLWGEQIPSELSSDNWGKSLAVNANGDIYIDAVLYIGQRLPWVDSFQNTQVVKLNASGEIGWSYYVGSRDNVNHLTYISAGIALDSAGNVFVSGIYNNDTPAHKVYFDTIKLAP